MNISALLIFCVICQNLLRSVKGISFLTVIAILGLHQLVSSIRDWITPEPTYRLYLYYENHDMSMFPCEVPLYKKAIADPSKDIDPRMAECSITEFILRNEGDISITESDMPYPILISFDLDKTIPLKLHEPDKTRHPDADFKLNETSITCNFKLLKPQGSIHFALLNYSQNLKPIVTLTSEKIQDIEVVKGTNSPFHNESNKDVRWFFAYAIFCVANSISVVLTSIGTLISLLALAEEKLKRESLRNMFKSMYLNKEKALSGFVYISTSINDMRDKNINSGEDSDLRKLTESVLNHKVFHIAIGIIYVFAGVVMCFITCEIQALSKIIPYTN